MDELYRELRDLVADNFRIEIRDGKEPKVTIVPDTHTTPHPWTSFKGIDIEDSLKRAIDKLRYPEKDYRDLPSVIAREGMLWKASERSVYGEKHIRGFLKEANA